MSKVHTLASGARQFVVQEALEMTWWDFGSYFSSFTPITNICASAEGAEMMTCTPVIALIHGK